MRSVADRRRTRSAIALMTAALCVAWAIGMAGAGQSASAPGSEGHGSLTYDIRVTGGDDFAFLLREHGGGSPESIAERGRAGRARMEEGLGRLRRNAPGAEVTLSPLTGSAEILRVHHGALTGIAPGARADQVVLDFLREHADLYGLSRGQAGSLRMNGESLSRSNGMRMVVLEQEIHGRPVFQAEMRAIVDREGRLVRTTGRLIPDLDEARVPGALVLPPEDSLEEALRGFGVERPARRMRREPEAMELTVEDPFVIGSVRTWPVYFPLAPGVVAPAWAHVVFSSGPGDWYIVVDATTGALLWRKNIRAHASTQEARFSVYTQTGGQPADSPAPGSPNSLTPGSSTQFAAIARTNEAMLSRQDLVASPDGWIPDGGNTTTGNNADAFLDRTSSGAGDFGTLDLNGHPIGNPDASGRNRDFFGTTPRDFSYTPAPVGNNPGQGDDPSTAPYQRGVVTSLFYLTNWYHDRLYALGFDEAARNFQSGNFGRGGTPNDRILAKAQSGANSGDANNAFFSTPPDGSSGAMSMFLFPGPNPDRDAGLDAEIVLHELTHGLTHRIIGNATSLGWGAGGSMGEGWSDFYAMSLLNTMASDLPGGQYANGGYVTHKLSTNFTENYVYGIRRFPYSTDNTVNPLTWADVDETTHNLSGGYVPSPNIAPYWLNFGSELHNRGEVWALTLWEVRSRIIAANSGNVSVGNEIMLQIVTDALKMTPIDPSFTQARDAILDADCAANACANEASIWSGFADRGLGYGAYASLGIGARTGVKESFALPLLDAAAVVVNDFVAGDADGRIEPGETASLIVTLANPWGHSSRSLGSATATLVSLTPGATVIDGSSTFGPIPANGSAVGDPFVISADLSSACGSNLKFTLSTTSALGTTSVPLTLRLGAPGGMGTPITFTATPSVAIPDNLPSGITSSLAVTADLSIADVNLKIDSLTHPFVGDLSVKLKAPNGFGADMIYHPDQQYCEWYGCWYVAGGNDGDNFTNTTIDDESSNDLRSVGRGAAPFTNSWKPVWNPYDSVRQLSRLDGISTEGTWRLFVADLGPFDLGTLNSWSLVVTPRDYTCVCSNCCTSAGQQDDDADTVRICAGDCDDANPAVYPGAPQVCDGVNNNCSHFFWPALTATNEADNDADGLSVCQADCDDTRASVYPGAPQICDGRNNNCSDPSWPAVPTAELDGDGDGAFQCGDCNDTLAGIYPGAPEVCDGLNNNCNDSGWPALGTLETDTDGDGLATCAGDCDDGSAAVYPGAPQLCGDGLNNDCNHPSWPSLTGTIEADNDGDGLSTCLGDCNDADAGSSEPAGEVTDLMATHNKATGITTLSWGPPPTGGGAGQRSDIIRSTSPSDFVSSLALACLESNDAGDRVATDPDEPLFSISFYLQRWENGCPGPAVAGRDSNGVVKPTIDCP